MATKTIVTCDVCEREKPSVGPDVWTSFTYFVSCGAIRREYTLDFCPLCQDDIIDDVQKLRRKKGLPIITFKFIGI